ncbi:MAG: flagellar basal body P-ring formation chaperone FlgA [Thiobacillus sp.]
MFWRAPHVLIRPMALLALCVAPFPAQAQDAAQSAASLETTARQFLKRQTQGMAGLITISVAPVKRALPACEALDAFQPTGSPRIGKTTVGVQCTAPVRWTAYLPAEIRVISQYVVTTKPLPPGHLITAADVLQRQGDLGSLPPDVVTDPATVLGYRTLSGLAVHAAIRSQTLRPPLAVQQGQTTQLRLQGPGFSIASAGQALASVSRDEPVRVRTASGQVVSGMAQDHQQVIVNF